MSPFLQLAEEGKGTRKTRDKLVEREKNVVKCFNCMHCKQK